MTSENAGHGLDSFPACAVVFRHAGLPVGELAERVGVAGLADEPADDRRIQPNRMGKHMVGSNATPSVFGGKRNRR
ncbi:hypothetical protein K7640_18055 [Micromonospora sp. PLK6-60]|uniref:hypothetical protein n=1 Tax=Micromonospora sp. PLK6-60 TaxID=2873383 RepID=UPI001CA73AE4|nr:hypothetical protein [Micromonospora sp. PLK6-60]MBY8873737.1 hypothetical protein [Micromonospora sp. PLK6-60]